MKVCKMQSFYLEICLLREKWDVVFRNIYLMLILMQSFDSGDTACRHRTLLSCSYYFLLFMECTRNGYLKFETKRKIHFVNDKSNYIIHDLPGNFAILSFSLPSPLFLQLSSISLLVHTTIHRHVSNVCWRTKMWSEITAREDNRSFRSHSRWELQRSLQLYCLRDC